MGLRSAPGTGTLPTHHATVHLNETAYYRQADAKASLCAIERAIALNQNDTSARLYLGLTLARSDDRQGGLTEIESSMKAIHDFLEYVTQAFRFSFGQYWDPTRQIRSAIESNLAMIRSKEIVWPRLIADGEWLGKEIDEEIDRARYDEIRDRSRENDGGGDSHP